MCEDYGRPKHNVACYNSLVRTFRRAYVHLEQEFTNPLTAIIWPLLEQHWKDECDWAEVYIMWEQTMEQGKRRTRKTYEQ